MAEARSRAAIFAIGSLLVAGATAFLLHLVLQGYRQELEEARTPTDVVEVVTATQDLSIGVPIEESWLSLVAMPESAVDEAVVFTSIEEVAGGVPHDLILTGEVVRHERLAQSPGDLGLDVLVSPGNRALTIQAERDAVVAGLLLPGNIVDVIVTIRPDTNELNANWVTETILQGVQVLAVGTTMLGEEAEPGENMRQVELVTLEVKPAEAEKLAMASARGELHLSLRSDVDVEMQENRGPLVTNALVGLSEKGARPARRVYKPRQAPREVAEVIEGTSTSIEQFDTEGRKVSGRGGR